MKCVKCKGVFPPGMTVPTYDGKAAICHFCKQDKNKIRFVINEKTGESVTYTRQHVIKEYEKYLKEVIEMPNIKNLIVEDAVKKMKEEINEKDRT